MLLHILGEIVKTAEVGLVFRLVWTALDQGKEITEHFEDEGRRWVAEGKLLPQPHVEMTPVDN